MNSIKKLNIMELTDEYFANLIPDDVINPVFETITDSKSKGDYKQKAAKSSFLLTVNTNISTKSLNTPDLRKASSIKLLRSLEHIKQQINNGQWLKPRPNTNLENWVRPEVELFEPKLEIGGKMKRLHCHCIIILTGSALIKLDELRKYMNDQFNKPHIDLKYVQTNSLDVLKSYVDKQRTSTMPRIPKAPTAPNQPITTTPNQPTETVPDTVPDPVPVMNYRVIGPYNIPEGTIE